MIIQGADSGRGVKVNEQHRLLPEATTSTAIQAAAASKNSFLLSFSNINLTNASESGIAWLKNTLDGFNLRIVSARLLVGPSTGASSSLVTVKSFKNPTGGTLSTTGLSIDKINTNYGAIETLAADAFKGAQGSTITGGISTTVPQTVAAELYVPAPLILVPSSTWAVSVTPPTGNSSMFASLQVELFKEPCG